ncbi:MAG: CDP-diacylglycerol--glycerol-3-phosphate 3-phosphatidyltransferase [Proteobacteria bacterium]|nr:CDP-diacylglycerol--glycerol-3-phosphate 3-phosphatidyltransferase [Pseudomonadota bacterium]
MNGLPTALTLFRMIMGPVLAGMILWAGAVLYSDRPLAGLLFSMTLVLFVLAAATDWLDGYLARKLNAVTPLGAALDHVADKVLIACMLLALAYSALPLDLAAAAVIIVGRDLAVAGLREGLSNAGKTLPVNSLGRWKAAAEMAGVGAFLAYQGAAILLVSANVIVGLRAAAEILLWAAALIALISGAVYGYAATKRA